MSGTGGSRSSGDSASASTPADERPVDDAPAQQLGRHRRVAVQARAVLLPRRPERAGGVAELAVADEPLEQLARRLVRVEVLELLLDVLLEQQARLHLEQRGDEHHELRGGVEVELAGVGEVDDVLRDDPRDADLPDVDLVAQDQRDEQVERSVEDVEVELE